MERRVKCMPGAPIRSWQHWTRGGISARGATGGRLRWKWPAHYPCPALARRQPPARPILCRCAARRLPINRAGRRRAGPKSRASRAVRVPRRCLWTWQDDPAARAMRGASGCAGSLLHGLACCPPAASPSQSSCLPMYISVPAVKRALNMPLDTRHPRVVRP